MKKYYFSVLFFIFCFYNVYPQIQQGKSLLGFSLSGDFSKENSKVIANGIRNSYSFSISPNFGIFLSDNFLIGLSIGYGISHSDYNTTDSTQPVVSELIRAHQISLAPFTRYYLSLGGKFYFFLQGTIFAGYNYRVVYSNSLIQDDAGINDFAFGLSFNPGVNYFISDKFLLEFTFGSLAYTHINTKINTSDDINLNFSFSSISIGLLYMF